MRFEASVQRLLIFILIGFGAIMAAAVYWTVVGPETVLNTGMNYRLGDAAARVVRGQIYDRSETPLVANRIDANGFVTRETPDASLFSLIGYMSRRYGFGGAEAVYNGILNGTTLTDSFTAAFQQDVLHLPTRGSDIRLTLDLATQRAAHDALQLLGANGAAVVMDAQNGNILALVSQPSVNPAELDTRWPELIESPDDPFVNRATQGRYTPGSALSPTILTAWLIDGRGLNDILRVSPDGDSPLCNPPTGELAVRAAFINACGDALVEMVAILGREKFESTANLFGLYTPVSLDSFTISSTETISPEPVLIAPSTPSPSALLGLDDIRRSPLDMAVMAAAIANNGNAPQPRLLAATRAPDAANWTPLAQSSQSTAVTTAQTAGRVADAMRETAVEGIAQSDACAGTDIGAILGLSHPEDGATLFFIGFARLANNHPVVAVISAEKTALDRAADISTAGKTLLCTALATYGEG